MVKDPGITGLSIVCALALGLGVECGGSSAASAPKTATGEAKWQREIAAAKPLELNPNGPISIKRDVHDLVVGTTAAEFAAAFEKVMEDPERRFGLIRVDRLSANVNKPFRMGERFQGRYELSAAGRQKLSGIWKQLFDEVVEDKNVADLLWRIENGRTSDYGEIIQLDLKEPKHGKYAMTYRYLAPSPIAGSSTFEVSEIVDPDEEGVGPKPATLVRQIFVYQETSEGFAKFFSHGGLRLHDQVVYSQVMQAAEAAGVCIRKSDIQQEYAAEL